MLVRRNGYRGLGAVEVKGAAEPAAGAAKGAAAGSIFGPVGTAIGGAAGAVESIMKATEDAKKSRAARTDAQTQVVKWLQAAEMIRDKTAQFRNLRLDDDLYGTLYKQFQDIANGINIALRAYKTAAGIAGLGRSKSEKRADRAIWAGQVEKIAQDALNEALDNISTGRGAGAPAPAPGPEPARTYAPAAAAPAGEGKGGGAGLALMGLALALVMGK